MELTEVQFWEDYWAGCKLPSEVDQDFSFERCVASAIKEHLPPVTGDVLEVGCAPGKWLAFMAKEFGLTPHGIEYSEAGSRATLKNFELLGLPSGQVQSGDFFKLQPGRQYDVVMSFGFIEHFSDVDSVVESHLQWLKPGGVLILGVPNFRGIYHPLQRVLDPGILDKHNLEIMRPEYFRHLAVRYNLTPDFIGYVGSFEPSLPIAKPGSSRPAQLLVRAFLRVMRKVRNLHMLDTINHPTFSSYLLSIYRKGPTN
ncbi:class I SAM-dependent methyltransferase [Lacisediminimonas profundi]|uniref:class I SAM-dependent methyltransferase n=1 Tax=Lacisediminimonas profundi TaxID=2603856 RepID=UPI00124B541B|nr:class I SAM-dependent methyltransferase [Lacisediminimonas profundi]